MLYLNKLRCGGSVLHSLSLSIRITYLLSNKAKYIIIIEEQW